MLGTGKGVRTFARDSGSSEALGIMVFVEYMVDLNGHGDLSGFKAAAVSLP